MIDRRKFLRLGGGALIASATMAEAGVIAEMLDWLKRKPAFSIPSGAAESFVRWIPSVDFAYGEVIFYDAKLLEPFRTEMARRIDQSIFKGSGLTSPIGVLRSAIHASSAEPRDEEC